MSSSREELHTCRAEDVPDLCDHIVPDLCGHLTAGVTVAIDDAAQLTEFGFWNNSRGKISCKYVDVSTYGSDFRVGSYCDVVLFGRRS